MESQEHAFIIGIDLGTTNSAVSYVDLRPGRSRTIQSFPVSQLMGAGEFGAHNVLPSFLYVPGAYEIDKEAIRLPWPTQTDDFVGVFARDYGGKLPSRLVASAKSWLCHDQVDRTAPILPWGSPKEIAKVSPVEATALYLSHIRKAWNLDKNGDDSLYLEHQRVTITVPASFNEVARELTLEAARKAGLPNVTLLEEPLAAFYSWLLRHEKDWHQYVTPGELILVCDVGGGTTDFTLICLRKTEGGSPRFERLAVGDHLILGGDNVDLALARLVEMKLGKQNLSLKGDRWKTLCHLCRGAKERILDQGRDRERITLIGEGSQLIGGTVSATLSRDEVESVVLDGFYPEVTASDLKRQPQALGGVTEFGLPYESDPAITRHMAGFLHEHREAVSEWLGKDPIPDLILFNGGSLKPSVIQDRIRASLRTLFGIADAASPKILENPHPDLAVSLGAAYYGLVKSGIGVKVGSGSPRSYYLGVGTGTGDEKKALCVVERGLDEGAKITLPESGFQVLANQQVQFDVYASSYRARDKAGDLVSIDDSLTPLPPIRTQIQYGKKGEALEIPAHIAVEYTELGSLLLWCASDVSSHRWQLSFQLRKQALPEIPKENETLDIDLVERAVAAVMEAFHGNDGRFHPAKIVANVVEKNRNAWPLGLLRKLTDALLAAPDLRRRSADHEVRWLNLVGFAMRPGMGDAFDGERIQSLWKLYKEGPVFSGKAQNRNEWWILWRRVAAGLKPGHQRQILQDITPLLFLKNGAKSKLSIHEIVEIWSAIANMEYLNHTDKTRCVKALFSTLHPKKTPPRLIWAISRFGSRELLYGPADKVVPPELMQSWVETLMQKKWADPSLIAPILVRMTRLTGDRTRDLDSERIHRVILWLEKNGCTKEVHFLKEVVRMERQEEKDMFGESLPAGIRLHAS